MRLCEAVWECVGVCGSVWECVGVCWSVLDNTYLVIKSGKNRRLCGNTLGAVVRYVHLPTSLALTLVYLPTSKKSCDEP